MAAAVAGLIAILVGLGALLALTNEDNPPPAEGVESSSHTPGPANTGPAPPGGGEQTEETTPDPPRSESTTDDEEPPAESATPQPSVAPTTTRPAPPPTTTGPAATPTQTDGTNPAGGPTSPAGG